MSPPPLYSYSNVPSPSEGDFHLRFIRLHPDLSKDNRIQCSLITTKLCPNADSSSCNPNYYALSYEWGESQLHPLEVEINGRRLFARKNLWQYLDMARNMSELHKTYLWVDAICINQENIVERNEQVSCMGEVYANAERVVVWLGSGTATLEKIINILLYSSTASGQQNLSWSLDSTDAEYSPSQVRAHKAALESSARDQLQLELPLSDMFEQIATLTYWSRAWVAQEMFHAKCIDTNSSPEGQIVKCIMFQYGEVSTTFDCLQLAAQAISEFLRPIDPRYHLFRSLAQYMNILNGMTPKLDLRGRFQLFNEWPNSSTDPRDLIYALRSMYTGGQSLQVDYREDTSLLLLRMLAQLKQPVPKVDDINNFSQSQIKAVVNLASRFRMEVAEFRIRTLDAAEKLKTTDMSILPPALRRQYEEAVLLLNTSVVYCDIRVAVLPHSMLYRAPDSCVGYYRTCRNCSIDNSLGL